MMIMANMTSGWQRMLILPAMLVLLSSRGSAQVPIQASSQSDQSAQKGDSLDSVVGLVGGHLILESDVNEEMRFAELQPFRIERGESARDQAINRLIDRILIVQQARIQTLPAVTDVEVNTELEELRKQIPACGQFHCETDAGWQKFLASHGITAEEMQEHWRLRIQVLRYIEARFRPGANISHQQIQDYYEKTLLPQFAKQNAKAPPLDDIEDRIQEVLLQQQVSMMLDDWLKSLRAQGSVQIFKPGEEAP